MGLDVESDGDADFIIGSLDGPDRLLINDGSGVLTLAHDVFEGRASGGTLSMALADFNGDGIIDVVDAQGEVPGHEDENVYLGTSVLKPDTAPPVCTQPLWAGPAPECTTTARRTRPTTGGRWPPAGTVAEVR